MSKDKTFQIKVDSLNESATILAMFRALGWSIDLSEGQDLYSLAKKIPPHIPLDGHFF